jgi:serine/threonine-protein kinase
MGDHVKILDFGLAKLNQETSNLTSGVVVGTPSYMAPEQIRGLLIDPRVDIYACGVLLFELLTGTKPFRSANNEPLEVCMMHLNNPVPRLADMVPGRDFGVLEDIVTHALAKDREQRFATAGAFANALAAALPAYRHTPPLGATMPLAEADLVQAGRSFGSFDAPGRQRAELAPTTASPPHGMPIDTRAATRQQAGPAPAVAPRRSARNGWIAIGGLMLLAAVIGVGVLATRDRAPEASPASAPSPSPSSRPSSSPSTSLPSPTPAPAPGRGSTTADEPPSPTPPPPPDDDPAGRIVTRVEELVSAGRRDAAINLLVKARKTHPRDARLAYHAGLLFMNRMWWPDGLKNLRAAIQLDPGYKTDAKLIETVLRGFNSTAHYDWTLANFLHDDIGPAAKPFFDEAAKHHKNPVVRKRAANELRRYR